jgi:hypothetical protein
MTLVGLLSDFLLGRATAKIGGFIPVSLVPSRSHQIIDIFEFFLRTRARRHLMLCDV